MDVAVHDFGEAAAFLSRHDRGDVDFGEDPLVAEGLAEQGAAAHLVADGFYIGSELGIGQALGQQVQGLQDGQSGADQGDKLLVEDEELLQVDLLASAEQSSADASGAGLDGIDQEALMGVLLAEFLLGGGGLLGGGKKIN